MRRPRPRSGPDELPPAGCDTVHSSEIALSFLDCRCGVRYVRSSTRGPRPTSSKKTPLSLGAPFVVPPLRAPGEHKEQAQNELSLVARLCGVPLSGPGAGGKPMRQNTKKNKNFGCWCPPPLWCPSLSLLVPPLLVPPSWRPLCGAPGGERRHKRKKCVSLGAPQWYICFYCITTFTVLLASWL